MLDDFIDNLNNSLNIELIAMSRQIIMPNNIIPNFGNNANDLKKIKTFQVTSYRDNNNIIIKRSTIMKILEYRQLRVEKLLQLWQI